MDSAEIFREILPRAGPPLPPRNEEDRVDRTVLRYGQHRIYGRRRIYRRSTVGSVETPSSLAGNIIRGLLSRSIFGQTSFYPVSLFPRFHLYLSSIFQRILL